MIILTPITINNHFNNANYVTKVDHLCSERHTFNFQGKMYKKRKMIIRVVSIILCVMMILGVFSILMYTLSGF